MLRIQNNNVNVKADSSIVLFHVLAIYCKFLGDKKLKHLIQKAPSQTLCSYGNDEHS